jgi:hypothetical protein
MKTPEREGLRANWRRLIAEEAFEYLDGPIMRITAPDTPVPYSPLPWKEFFLPKTPDIIRVDEAVGGLLNRAAHPSTSAVNFRRCACPHQSTNSEGESNAVERRHASMGESIFRRDHYEVADKRWAIPLNGTSPYSRFQRTRWTLKFLLHRVEYCPEFKVKEGETVQINTVVAVISDQDAPASISEQPQPTVAAKSANIEAAETETRGIRRKGGIGSRNTLVSSGPSNRKGRTGQFE